MSASHHVRVTGEGTMTHRLSRKVPMAPLQLELLSRRWLAAPACRGRVNTPSPAGMQFCLNVRCRCTSMLPRPQLLGWCKFVACSSEPGKMAIMFEKLNLGHECSQSLHTHPCSPKLLAMPYHPAVCGRLKLSIAATG